MAKKYAKKAASKAYEVYAGYQAHKSVARRTHELNSFNPEMAPTKKATKRKRVSNNKTSKRKWKIKPRGNKQNSRLYGRKFVPAHQTGYVGSFAKPFKHKKSKKVRRFERKGIVFKREATFVSSGSECVYLGHGTPMNQVILNAVRALLRSTLLKAGFDMGDWQDPCNMVAVWKLYYVIGDGTVVFSMDVNFATTNTWLQIADSMTGLIRATITDTTDQNNWIFHKSQISILIQNQADPNLAFQTINIGEINLKQYHLEFDYYSIQKVKNVTLSDATFREGTSSANADDIESQPLVGKLYSTDKWGNGFLLDAPSRNGGVRQMYAEPTTGVIDYDASQLGYTDNFLNPYRKPVPGYMLHTKKYSTVRINPGELKTDVIKWRAKMSWNTFAQKCIFSFENSADKQMRLFGAAHVFAFEREVEIGIGVTAERPPIRLASQVDFVLKICGKTVQHSIPPLVDTFD